MIKMLRVDDRLLHGQVAFIWSKHLDIQGIVIANDKLPNDSIQLMAIKMAAPDNIKLLIKTVDEAAALMKDPRASSMRILAVTKDPIDAARFMSGLDNKGIVESINIGNSGRIDRDGKEMLTKEVYASADDIAAMKELLGYNLPFDIQMVPTNGKVNVGDLLAKHKK